MDYTGNDFYCDVALKGQLPLDKEYESDNVLAFKHTRPHWQTHIVVVPKKHIRSFTSLTSEDMPIFLELVKVLKTLGAKIEKEQGAARILTNLGKYQDSKHLHFHIAAGEQLI
ncbi:MAG TPA: HIT domain-containing protein [Candidatus Paceibacterota bacterium]|nr:HIT domain-containing protein [Candidatus Paceibacterota bacterium]